MEEIMAQLRDTSITGDCSISGALLHNGANYFNDTGWIRLWESQTDPSSVVLGRSKSGITIIYGSAYGTFTLPTGKTTKICTIPSQLLPDWCGNIPVDGLCTVGSPRGAHSGALQVTIDANDQYIGLYNGGLTTSYWGFMITYFTKL